MQYFHKRFNFLLALPLLGILQLAHAEVDTDAARAIESIWDTERSSISVLGSTFSSKASRIGTAYQARTNNSPTYMISGEDDASVIYGSKRFDATTTPWGTFPRLDMEKTRLLELTIPKKRYLVFAGPGKGVFSAGSWQRYSFLHVIDATKPAAPVYYPLVADADLGERVLGRLPGSLVLNYARLVPTVRSAPDSTDAYEVSLYALNSQGPVRVMKQGLPVAYSLERQSDGWVLTSISSTPVTDALDKSKRPFSAPSLFVTTSATSKQEGDKK